MEDLLGPIGAIQTPHGELEVGNVGISNCVYLRYKTEANFAPCLVYSPNEFQNLLDLAKQAQTLSAQIQEGAIIRLGAMSPKPATLRLALIHRPGANPVLLLRVFQVRDKVDILVEPTQLIPLLKMAAVDAPSSLEGMAQIDHSGAWFLHEKRISIAESSGGTGINGEYLQASEVRFGEKVRAWTDGQNRLVCFQVIDPSENEKAIAEPLGQSADEMLARGHTHLARETYHKVAKKLVSGGRATPLWVAKTTLGILLSEIVDGNDQKAQEIWLGQSSDPVLQKGIQLIESGATGLHDTLCYQQISAYFHSLNPNQSQAQSGVNGIMQSVCQEISKTGEKQLLKMALGNWFLYLEEIFEGEPPNEALVDWNSVGQGAGRQAQSISFPKPAPWCEPDARVAQSGTDATTQSVPENKMGKMAILVLVACFALAVIFKLTSASTPPSAQPSELRTSMKSMKFGTPYDTISKKKGWSGKPYFLNEKEIQGRVSGVGFHFNEQRQMTRMNSAQLELDGKVVIPKGTSQAAIQKLLGEPAGKGGGGAHIYYVFEDGGERFVLEVTRDYGLGLEPAKGRWEEARSISLEALQNHH